MTLLKQSKFRRRFVFRLTCVGYWAIFCIYLVLLFLGRNQYRPQHLFIDSQEQLSNSEVQVNNKTISHLRLTGNTINEKADENLVAKHLKLVESDKLYADKYRSPIVIPEFKLIFFSVPKVACTEFKLLLRKLQGHPWPKSLPIWPKEVPLRVLHNPDTNNFTTLQHYPVEEAEAMMKSDDWTRAIFLREPKERILSAFNNKYVQDGYKYYKRKCCTKLPDKQTCFERVALGRPGENQAKEKEFLYFLKNTKVCQDAHWDPQMSLIDWKWWPSINFIGYMHNLEKDSRTLLSKINSSKDGKSAWDSAGASGWGADHRGGFLQTNDSNHSTNSHEKLKQFYTEETERFVEEHWKSEWDSPFFSFEKIHISIPENNN